MKSVVIYFSKTESTKTIAEIMANTLQTKAISLNLITKKGRGTEEEREKEKWRGQEIRISEDQDEGHQGIRRSVGIYPISIVSH